MWAEGESLFRETRPNPPKRWHQKNNLYETRPGLFSRAARFHFHGLSCALRIFAFSRLSNRGDIRDIRDILRPSCRKLRVHGVIARNESRLESAVDGFHPAASQVVIPAVEHFPRLPGRPLDVRFRLPEYRAWL